MGTIRRWLKLGKIRREEETVWAEISPELAIINRLSETGRAESSDDLLVLRAALYLVASGIYRRKAQSC